jgi:hypothetical protein
MSTRKLGPQIVILLFEIYLYEYGYRRYMPRVAASTRAGFKRSEAG